MSVSAAAVAPQAERDPIRRLVDRTFGRAFAAVGFTPNAVTLLGTAVALGGCVLWMRQSADPELFWVGLIVTILGTGMDVVDGSVAYLRHMATPFGKILDSVTDRVVETAMFAALAWVLTHSWGAVGFVLAIGGSMMVSYVRSRAETVGLVGKDGWGPRHIRLPLLAVCVVIGHWEGLQWVGYPVAGLAWFTVFQRLLTIRGQLLSADEPEEFGWGGLL